VDDNLAELKNDNVKQELDIFYRESSKLYIGKNHLHYFHELILVKDGHAEFTICDKKYNVCKGSLILISNLEHHEIIADDTTVYKRYVLSISNSYCLLMIKDLTLMSLLIHRNDDFRHVIQLSREHENIITEHLETIQHEYASKLDMWSLRCALLITDILLIVYRENNMHAFQGGSGVIKTVVKVQQYIAENFMHKVTLEELGKRYFISKCYLSRMFQQITGYGFKEYIILYRLNEAKRLLRDSNLTVGEISVAVGYIDVNNFIRVFHTREGTTPYQYRKTALAEAMTLV